MKHLKIGIPRGMYIYEKPILFEYFFKTLGCEVVYSSITDKKVLENGIKYSVDEACLSSKIYLGHVYDLLTRSKVEKIDYIFIPRVSSFKKSKSICVKFFAMYDICKNIFDGNFITLNIDYENKESEIKSFIKLGKRLGYRYSEIIHAYLKARNMQKIYDRKKVVSQYETITKMIDKQKILIVAHPYITYDKYIGSQIIKYIKSQDIEVLYSDINSAKIRKDKSNSYSNISKSIYWQPSINLINGIIEYLPYIDGIIYLTVFPCGPDSLVNELLLRKIKDVPSINLVIDEQEIGAGLYTRLESFCDIIKTRKRVMKVSG